MKPIVKNKIAFFHPQGFIDGENVLEIISPYEIEALKPIKPIAVFISLKKIIFFNKKGISIALDYLTQIRDSCGAVIGFCDYDAKKFNLFGEMFSHNIFFSLFETEEVVNLFLGKIEKSEKEVKILIYNELADQKNQQAVELYERGYTPHVAKDLNEAKRGIKEFDYCVVNSYLGSMERNISIFIKNNVIVYTLKSFVDSDISKSFDEIYHENLLRVGFKVFLFDAQGVSFINVHGVNYISRLSNACAEYGATIVIAGLDNNKITKTLKQDLQDSGVLIYRDMKIFFDDKKAIADLIENHSAIRKNIGVTKQLVNVLPYITDATIRTVEVLSNMKAIKKSLQIQFLQIDSHDASLGACIGMYGDFNGILILLFDKKLTQEACRILLEDSKSSEADLLDALGEFVYIVGGKIINQLLRQNIKIDITMPRTFDTISNVLSLNKDNKGVQVDLDVSGQLLTLFLTK